VSLVDFILNVAGLLLWLNWRTVRDDSLAKTAPTTLRRPEPSRRKRWYFLAALGLLLFLRAVLYWQLGSAIDWTARLSLGLVTPPFRSAVFNRMFAFSLLSFGVMLAGFYLWLLLLSLVHPRSSENDSIQKLVRVSLGSIDRLPAAVKMTLPLIVVVLVWLLLAPLLAHWQIIPEAVSFAHRLEQGAVIGLWTYLNWKYLIGLLLALYLVHSYVYLGNHPLWNYVNVTATRLLVPFRPLPLRAGKVDFAPLILTALVFCGAALAEFGLKNLYAALPI
jgi:uncharacterized protein YggT (Ycf19 family)